ncbi:MAG: Glu/Leu/Phe/Val dehydrogenase dimerization domain-containing protein [bacterium]
MGIFDLMDEYGHEELVFCYDQRTELRAIIAVHDTTLGPALGGTRMWDYGSEDAAISEALRLSRSMTYQAAVSDCDTGGGKGILWRDPAGGKSEAYFRAFGRFIEGLGGRFITYADLGTDDRDMLYIRRETGYIAPFVSRAREGSLGGKATAHGVLWGMRACCKAKYGVSSVKGRTVAIQGVGEVGYNLARYLDEEGARLIITDIVYDAMKRVQDLVPSAEIVRPDEIYECDCDIFSPCAFGGVITQERAEKLKCKIIAGAAYDILESSSVGDYLHKKEILYAPDFVISAGELFQTSDGLQAATEQETIARACEIFEVLVSVFDYAERESMPPFRAARRMAEDRIERVGGVRSILAKAPQPEV